MAENEQKVFISYAWGEETSEREAIVNQIDQSLQKRGLKIIRDKRDLGYKGSIRKFMERIGEGDSIIVVISDKYLRSKNCMFELVQISKNKQLADRIFPIVLSDAKIYDAGDRLDYVEHWEKEKARLNKKLRDLTDFSNIQSVHEELNDYDDFRDEIDGLAGLLKDMNTLNPAMHKDSDFSELFTAIEKRMRELAAKLGPAILNNKQVSSTSSERKPIPVGLLVGGAIALVVIAFIVLNVLGNRNSNGSPTDESTQPSVVGAPTDEVATQTTPTEAATEVSVTETPAPTATEAGPPAFFTEKFTAGIDPALWESFILGDGNPDRAVVSESVTGIKFVLNDQNLSSYTLYQPIRYENVVIRLRAANVGTINTNKVSLICRRTGNTWYEFSVTSGGLWNLEYYSGSTTIIGTGATTALKSGQNINEYEMSCMGSEISLKVNGQAVRTITDDNLTDGQVGFSISSIQYFPVEIEVKQFEVAES